MTKICKMVDLLNKGGDRSLPNLPRRVTVTYVALLVPTISYLEQNGRIKIRWRIMKDFTENVDIRSRVQL